MSCWRRAPLYEAPLIVFAAGGQNLSKLLQPLAHHPAQRLHHVDLPQPFGTTISTETGSAKLSNPAMLRRTKLTGMNGSRARQPFGAEWPVVSSARSGVPETAE